MEKVMIQMVTGTKMLFPKQYAKKVMRKNELVIRAMQLQEILNTTKQMGCTVPAVEQELAKTMRSIRTINRQVPPCGEVVR